MYIITCSLSNLSGGRLFYLEEDRNKQLNYFIARGTTIAWGECYPSQPCLYSDKMAKALYLITERSYFYKCYRILVKNVDI
jgi:hypothetical protein